MYYKQWLECSKCGRAVALLRRIYTDKEKEEYLKLKTVCPRCGGEMRTTFFEELKKIFDIKGTDFIVAENLIGFMDTSEVRIDLKNLLEAGYGGDLYIMYDNKTVFGVTIDPWKRKVYWYEDKEGRKRLEKAV